MSVTDHWIAGEYDGLAGLYLFPGLNLVTIGANLIDVVALPVKLPLRWIKNGRAKKDIRLLQSMISTDQSFTVSASQFERLKLYLF